MANALLEMRGITKVYPNGVVANKDVEFSCAKARSMRLRVRTEPVNRL